MNVIARLEFELAFYDSAVSCVNHYTTRILSSHSQMNDFPEIKKSLTNNVLSLHLQKCSPIKGKKCWLNS